MKSDGWKAALAVIFFLSWASAVYSQLPPQSAPATPAPTETARDAKPADSIVAVDPKSYVLGPEDVILISVWREAELSGQRSVRPDGKISLPLIGDIQASGLTPDKLSRDIEAKLGEFLQRPQVTISVQQVQSRKYYVQGEVVRPGSYPLAVPTTVLQALIQAGGFRDFANTKKIVVMRGAERIPFNYKEVIKGKKLEQNILLEPGDYVIVP